MGFNNVNIRELLVAALLAVMPVSEVRGAIPYVLLVSENELSKLLGVVVSVVCNMVVPLIAFPALNLLDKLATSRYTPNLAKKAYRWLLDLGRRRALGLKKESYIALALFVGVPLPVTGAWTGCLVAHVLGLDRKKSVVAIELGVLIASVIVLAVAYAGIEALSNLFLG